MLFGPSYTLRPRGVLVTAVLLQGLSCTCFAQVPAQPQALPQAPVGTPIQVTSPVSAMTAPQIQALLAPVALYQDGLLSQMFLASAFPIDISQANMMQPTYAQMPPDQAAEAIRFQPWDPSVKSLLSFPGVLQMMASQPDWTRQLGDLYRTRPMDLMQAVQALRQQALKNGALRSGPQIQVTVDAQGQIVINPVNPQVIYVPQYNPTVVYGPWLYPAYPPYPIYNPGWGVMAFGVGIAAGAAIWAAPRWRSGVVVVNQPVYNNFTHRYGYPGVYSRPGTVAPAQGHWHGGSWHGGSGHH